MTSPELTVAAETDALLTRSSAEGVEGCSRAGCCQRRRRGDCFYVEPVLMAYCFIEFPMLLITQKYALDWIAINVFNATSSRGSLPPPASIPSPCDPNISDSERRLSDRVQSLTSLFTVVQSTVFGVPALIATIILGAGSDRLGRRFAILPPLLGGVVNILVAYSVIRTRSTIAFFLIGDFLYGCCGSYCAMAMSCFAYVADRTPAERRMLRITFLQLCMLVSGIVSPIAIGPVVSLMGVENFILILALVSVINFAYVYLFLHDDVHKVNQEPDVVDNDSNVSYSDGETTSGFAPNATGSGEQRHLPRFHVEPRFDDDTVVGLSHSLNRDNPEPRSELAEPRVESHTRTLCDGVRRVISLFLSPGPSRVRLNILMAAFFISMLPTFDIPLMNLFEMNQPLCWTVREIGLFMGATLGISTLGALVVTPVMKKCATDWHIAVTASVAAVVTNVYRFFVRNSLMMYLSSSLSMFVVLIIPSIRSLMSALVSDHEQGAVFGAIASVEVLCIVVGSVIFNTIYSKTLDIDSGFVFLVMAIFYVAASCLLLAYRVRDKVETRRQQLRNNEFTDSN